ncbi:MYB103 protein [Hibiscus syriacus]|uniref:MYB103 protein n=1 Tax=Hibiscus syriacus TaxID=106335 RepID=A0A6A2ZRS8_HIBSY|nr:MYB103 protein [Hibiscus syriacus]
MLVLQPSTILRFPKQGQKFRNSSPVRVQNSLSSHNLFYELSAIDSVYTVHALKSCTVSRNLELGFCIHAVVLKSRLQTDVFVNNSLLDMYMECGCIEFGRKMFDHMPERTVASWTAMISGYCHNGLADEGITTFIQILENELPNEFTLAAALQIVSENCNPGFICILHGYITKGGFLKDSFFQNSLIGAYAKSGILSEAVKLLERFSSRDVVSWTSIISGFVLRGSMHEALLVFFRMQEDGVAPNENSLINMYAENVQSESVFQVFARMNVRDIVSWNSLIRCLIKNDDFHEALNLLKDIHCYGGEMRPDFITMLTLIQGCSNSASFMPGQVIHGYITKAGLICDIFIQNALIDMYGRSGKLDLAEEIIEAMPTKDLGSWNSLIAAYGINGNGRLALQAFAKLNNSSPHKPNAITFTNIISACSHTRLSKKAMKSSRACRKSMEWNQEIYAQLRELQRSCLNRILKALFGELHHQTYKLTEASGMMLQGLGLSLDKWKV